MTDELKASGHPLSQEDLNRVRNPIGLDVGADTPEEIAVSIMAELTAVRGGYPGGFLKDRKGPIHTDREVRDTLSVSPT